jgi:hypothetical protein
MSINLLRKIKMYQTHSGENLFGGDWREEITEAFINYLQNCALNNERFSIKEFEKIVDRVMPMEIEQIEEFCKMHKWNTVKLEWESVV